MRSTRKPKPTASGSVVKICSTILNRLSERRSPAKRALGTVEKIECGNGSITFLVKIDAQGLKLKAKSPQDVKIAVSTPDAGGIQLGCGAKLPPIPVVITYRPKDKDGGEAVALEFVPKSFKLE